MPDREWILLTPGPANTSPRVRHALLTPDLCHREPEFFEVMRDCRERLVRLAGARDAFTAVLLPAPAGCLPSSAFPLTGASSAL